MDCYLMREFRGAVRHSTGKVLKKRTAVIKKLFLAGGLTPDNVKAAIEAVRSDVVDISSGVEYDDVSVKGKDESKVKAFIQNAKF